MEDFTLNILNLFLVLVAAWLGGIASKRLGYPPILGELIIGILLGPTLLGLIKETETIKVLAEIGITLLMVYIGIEIDFSDLKKASWAGLLAAIGGFIVPFALGYYTIIYFGGTPTSGLFVAIAVGVTSLATKSRILVDLKLLNTRIAYVLMAGALISDTLALVIFAGIVSFADAGSLDMSGLLMVIGKAILFFVGTILIGNYLLPVLGRRISKFKNQSSTMYFTLILIIAFGYAELAELAGMHSILGAFMAGLFIKDNLFPKNIAREVQKSFFDVSIGFMAPIFFVSAGFSVNINVFQTDLVMLVTVVFVAIFGKIFGTMLFYLPSGHGWREGITVGAGMNGRGAVEIIIAGIGLEMGIINQNIFSILVFMAIFTTFTVPFMLKWTTTWLRLRGELVQVDGRRGIVILGINPVSLLMAKHLNEKEPIVHMVDANFENVEIGRARGFDCTHGNALKDVVMSQAKADESTVFVGLTVNSEVNLLAAQVARENFYIYNNYILLTMDEDGAGKSILEAIKASTVFAMKVHLEPWNQKIQFGDISEKQQTVINKTRTRDWVVKHGKNKILPLVIQDNEGKKRVFQYEDTVQPGETVIYVS
jgi:Kef-type K+ transport system membrane component KefB